MAPRPKSDPDKQPSSKQPSSKQPTSKAKSESKHVQDVEDLEDLEGDIEGLEGDIEGLEGDIEGLEGDIEDLEDLENQGVKPRKTGKPGKKKRSVEDDGGEDYDRPSSSVVVELGEIVLELDDRDEVVVSADDPYEDAYASADFEGSVVALMADHMSTSVAERRGALVASAKAKSEASRAKCWPGCTLSRMGVTPVFKYDKILVVDTAKDLADIKRQLDGLGGFDPRELWREISSLKDLSRAGRAADALRPISWKGPRSTVVPSAIDPVARHCVLPEEACDSLKITDGRFSRSTEGEGLKDTIRLLPGDRAELVDREQFEDYSPDAAALVRDLKLLSPGESDRAAEAMGISWNTPFVHALRRESGKAALELESETEDDADADADEAAAVTAPSAPRSDAPRAAATQKQPEADLDAAIAALEARLTKLGRPSKTKKATTRAALSSEDAKAGGGGGGKAGPDVVRVYANRKELEADEADARAVYGAEYDDTPRGLLKIASKLPPDSRTTADRIRQVADTRLSGKKIEDVERGGKAILVGDRVALRTEDGAEQVFMRAKEANTGALFWALQETRAARPDATTTGKRRGDAGYYSAAYLAPPSDEDAATFARDALAAAVARLQSASKKFVPDEAIVTRALNSMVDHGHYTAPDFLPLRKRVHYSGTVRHDTYETDEFRPFSLSEAADDASSGVSGYLEVAAASLLGTLFPRGIRLPKSIDGSAWLVKIAVSDGDPRYADLADGGGTDPLRLKFLVETSLNAAAVAVLLTDLEPAEASALLAGADVATFLESSKGREAWTAAVKKKLSPDAVQDAAHRLRLRSPLLDHIVEVVQSAEDRVQEAASLPPSLLRDWNGYRPSLDAMPAPTVVPVKAEDGAGRQVREAAPLADRQALGARLNAVLKRAGVPAEARAAFEGLLDRPGSDVASALKNGASAARAVLGMISASAKSDAVSRFRSVTPEDAKLIMKASEGSKAALAVASSSADAIRAWIDFAEDLPDEFVLLAAESAAERVKIARTDVDALLARMEAAKEAIKNEKIKFVESVDESAQSAMAALRKIGLQTIDDQIIAFDRNSSAASQAPRGDDDGGGDSYDTMDYYDDDDGLDYD